MTRAEKYLNEHPYAEQDDGIPYENPYKMLCAQDAGFDVPCCLFDGNWETYNCEDCWNEEAE